MRIVDGHFEDVIHFLKWGTSPEGYIIQQKKELVVRAIDFSIIARHMYKMGSDEVLQWYVPEFERRSIVVDAHVGIVGDHYVGRVTTQNILHAGLW